MADRSFLNNDLLLQRGAYLNMPLFTSIFNYGKCGYLTSNEVNEKKNIAWMHVEQAIQGLKSLFNFLVELCTLTQFQVQIRNRLLFLLFYESTC